MADYFRSQLGFVLYCTPSATTTATTPGTSPSTTAAPGCAVAGAAAVNRHPDDENRNPAAGDHPVAPGAGGRLVRKVKLPSPPSQGSHGKRAPGPPPPIMS